MSDNVLSCSKQKWQLLTCRSVFAFLGKFTGPPALRSLPSNWMHRRPGICYCFLFVIVFYLLLLLFFRKESSSTIYWFSPYIFSFFSAENTKKRRLEQNTVRWWSMVAYVVFSPFQVTWVCRSLQSDSLNLRCWYVRVLFGGIIPPMCCVTQKLIFSWDFYSDDEKRFERQKGTLRTVPVESL